MSNVRDQVHRLPLIVALLALVLIFIVRVLPPFGVDPLSAAVQSGDRTLQTLIVGFILLLGSASLAWKIHGWRAAPTQGFPWLDVTSHSVILLVVIFVYFHYWG